MEEQSIIALQKQLVQKQYSSIHSPVTYIGGRRYHFTEQPIIANVLIMLPSEFIDLPPALARQKYPSSQRPQCIKTSTDMSVNFAFSYMQDKVREDELVGLRNTAMDGLRKIYPQNDYVGAGLNYWGEKKGSLFSWFDYTGPTLDAETYSFNAFMVVNERLLYYLFNCAKEGYENWKPIIFETIASMRNEPFDWKGADRNEG